MLGNGCICVVPARAAILVVAFLLALPLATAVSGETSASPRITGPKVFGVRPNRPVLFTVTATGTKPVTFATDDLPPGLTLDAATGRISGSMARRGTYLVTFHARNNGGTTSRGFRIVVGDRICLTPPLGWNSCNRYDRNVSEQNVRETADAMVAKGLSDHGYSYVNIDDGWQGPRSMSAPYDADHLGPLTGIKPKFSADMKGLADYIHGKGLKFGLYSLSRSPSYMGFTGGETNGMVCSPQDVQQMADWGVDYLKYDGDDPQADSYAATGVCVRAAPRDIVLTICSSGGCSYKGADYYRQICNAWRIGYDLSDAFSAIKETAFNGYKLFPQPEPSFWAPYSGPGRWLDADMLVVGRMKDGPSATHLTHDEQYVHLSQDAMLASPILAGCDLPTLDEFTIGLLTDDEVLDVDQDPLGLQAVRVALTGEAATGTQVWARDLEDGSRAVALYNFTEDNTTVKITWEQLGISGPRKVRDLWRQEDMGIFREEFSAEVRPHGVVFVKVTPDDPGYPQITTQPVDPAPVVAGETASLSVTATGLTPLNYQWHKNGQAIAGATAARYDIRATATEDDGAVFRCYVSNSAGRVISYEAVLKVLKTLRTNLVRPYHMVVSSTEGVWTLQNATDGNPDSFWGALGADPQWAFVDLEATYDISEVKLVNLDGPAAFEIQVAANGARVTDASAWETIRKASGLKTYGTQDLKGLTGRGRYVRFLCTGRYGDHAPRIGEFEVYGSPVRDSAE
jgi:alpha-galactosidase